MGDYLRFWWAAFKVGRDTAWDLLGSGWDKLGRALVLSLVAALVLWIAAPFLEPYGVKLGGDVAVKAVVTALLGPLAVVALFLIVAVAAMLTYAPFKLWRDEHRKAAAFPWGGRKPLFEVAECWWDQLPGMPAEREAYVIFTIKRDVQAAKLKVWAYHNGARIRVVHEDAITASEGVRVRVPLARVKIIDGCPRFVGSGGDEPFEPHELKMVRIEMTAGKVVQEYRAMVMAHCVIDPPQWHLHVVAADNNPAFWPGAEPATPRKKATT